MATAQHTGIADLYEREVLPALTRRLDSAFPEFGWQRDTQGWRATDQTFTHATFGVRADRVVCHGDAPRGFLIHGQGATLWTTYLNHGSPARGHDFVAAVRALATRAGIDTTQLDRPANSSERKANLLHDTFVLCRHELASERGITARAYLESRGIPADHIDESGLGLMPDNTPVRLALISHGYSEAEIANSGVLADSRWPGRLIGAWRDEHSRITTLWARTTGHADGERYLYLRGAQRPQTLPYGVSSVLSDGSRGGGTDLLILEGVLDVHILGANGFQCVAALGGTAASPRLFERLADLGVGDITLALDNDPAGVAATRRAIDAAVSATRSPRIWVIDPDLLGEAKDPGELIQTRGPRAWERVTAAPICGITAYALELTGPLAASQHEPARRAALARASSWLAALHPRHSIEQTNALDTVANSLGYDVEATRRTFRAHHWHRHTDRNTARGIGR
jgi:DNA primase